jgi:anhydro-N-acetylmuramic acid kinase
MTRMDDLAAKPVLRVVGLMSGTSMDGVDAVVADIEGPADAPVIRQLGFLTVPYLPALREEVLAVASGDARSAGQICRLDHAVGEAFGAAARRVVEETGLDLETVDLVGSHGQTIFHDADRRETWQIGEPSRIAAALLAPVVSDFRRTDQAAGGQGAPLVPLFDALFFRRREVGRILLNIGGIANVSVLPQGQGRDGVYAFDTGPGNVLIDEFLQHATEGRLKYDERGKLATRGTVDEDLLAGFLEHPYFYVRPPKSTGREIFGASFVALTLGEWAVRGERIEDIVATLTEFTAISIAASIKEYVLPNTGVREVFVSGGGVHNDTLMRRLREELEGMSVDTLEKQGFSSDAKESLAFALLARETICGRAGNIPGATGATRAAVLGVITASPRW